jgi:uncharacterized membrane protein YdbT with pleckstrin-like domain
VGLSAKLLGADERVLMHMRTHGKVLFWPAVGLVACGAILGVGAALIPYDFRPVGQFAVAIVAGVLATWWSVIPFLRWRTTTYTLTNYRLITRTGILNKSGTNLPLARVNDVTYQRSLSDRMLGCGTLRVQTAADAGAVVLDDVPDVEDVHVTMSELIGASVRS